MDQEGGRGRDRVFAPVEDESQLVSSALEAAQQRLAEAGIRTFLEDSDEEAEEE